MAGAVRNIVSIDQKKCNGCGACVTACHEGAIRMAGGKAELVSDIYCDGLGDCLGPCPTGAISIVARPAEAYDEQAVAARMNTPKTAAAPLPCGCPGSMAKSLKPAAAPARACGDDADSPSSELMNWPVQLRLVPPAAPYLRGADILLAADCAPVAVPDFHRRFLRGRPVIIACPKLEDNEPQITKLAEILRAAAPASLTVVRMEVPCCGGLARAAEQAAALAGTGTPVTSIVAGIGGGIL